jgi:hypothetical protein
MGDIVFLIVAGLFWLLMTMVVFGMALLKRKNPLTWLLYGLLIWPIALPHLLLAPALTLKNTRPGVVTKKRKCRVCGEKNEPAATACTHCGRYLPPPLPN